MAMLMQVSLARKTPHCPNDWLCKIKKQERAEKSIRSDAYFSP
jgi:hypothetical protein